MSEEKKALVFDTNFILQEKRLDEVVKNLQKEYIVYVPQVAIDERIAQQCRDLKQKYDILKETEGKVQGIATIKYTHSFEELSKKYQESIQKKYEKLFGKNIIKLIKNEKKLNEVIDRANRKAPPFSADKNASDKGFKDCLLWLSLLDFFKNHGEKEVVFLSDDKKAFISNASFFSEEFKDITGKKIEIKPNNYYNEVLKKEDEVIPIEQPKQIDNIDELRDEIEKTIESLRVIEEENWYGDSCWYKTFITTKKFDNNNISLIFSNLPDILLDHFFEKEIAAKYVFNFDNNIEDGDRDIPFANLEAALNLCRKIQKEYPNYIDSFYWAVAKGFNKNYEIRINNDDDLPF